MEKPKYITEKHLRFLDRLRESGVTNMYGASPYLEKAFSIKREIALEILGYWMKTFKERHTAKSA